MTPVDKHNAFTNKWFFVSAAGFVMLTSVQVASMKPYVNGRQGKPLFTLSSNPHCYTSSIYMYSNT